MTCCDIWTKKLLDMTFSTVAEIFYDSEYLAIIMSEVMLYVTFVTEILVLLLQRLRPSTALGGTVVKRSPGVREVVDGTWCFL